MFTPNLGIEGGWVDLGKAKGSAEIGAIETEGGLIPLTGSVELKSSGPFLAGIAAAPIGNASVFGKLGLANLKSEASVSIFGVSDSTSTRHTDVFYGIGAGYNFTRNFGVRAE